MFPFFPFEFGVDNIEQIIMSGGVGQEIGHETGCTAFQMHRIVMSIDIIHELNDEH